jgi:hypothetical protein
MALFVWRGIFKNRRLISLQDSGNGSASLNCHEKHMKFVQEQVICVCCCFAGKEHWYDIPFLAFLYHKISN